MTPPDARAELRAAVARLSAAGIDSAAGDARRLMEHAAGIAPGLLSAHLPDRIGAAALARFAALVERRAAREPVSHLTGSRSFYGRDFIVTPDTLDPRPDSETLIEAALEQRFSRALDLGTGTGCLLLTLLAERPGTTGLGTDISPAALAVADRNSTAIGLSGRAGFRQSDWFGSLTGESFDLILSNPPYIALDEMTNLAPEVRDHEPWLALTDHGDGLTAYRAITRGTPAHLRPGGRLLVEIGWKQGPAVAALFRDSGLERVEIRRDLNGHDRVVGGFRPVEGP